MNENRSKGLGDTVAKVIAAATFNKVQPCSACEKRKEALNRLIPYRNTYVSSNEDAGKGLTKKNDG
jgi:hypothetical protein